MSTLVKELKSLLIALLVFPALAVVAGCKQEARDAPADPSKPGIDTTFEVPQEAAAQVVHVVTRDIPAGAAIPWHTHPGVEIAYVESGDVELEMAGQRKQLLSPGGHFMVPRGTIHSGRNVGDQPARLVLTYVVDNGAPLRTPANPPGN